MKERRPTPNLPLSALTIDNNKIENPHTPFILLNKSHLLFSPDLRLYFQITVYITEIIFLSIPSK